MNKKLVAVAVAGVFAAPVSALAQSSVTISGLFKAGVENLKYSNYQRATSNSSQYGVVDDSSRIIFNVVEDLGGGMQAVGQFDFRPSVDGGVSSNAAGTFGATGNTHVGLQNRNSWGRVIIGRQELHYYNNESNLADKNSLRANSVAILAYAGAYGGVAGSGGAAVVNSIGIAGATRTPNVIHYLSPNWSGFTVIAAYSSQPFAGNAGLEGDIASGARKGYAWMLNPNYEASNWQIGYSYWDGKPDGAGTAGLGGASNNQRGNRAYGSYSFLNVGGGALKIGLAWDNSKLTSYASGVANATLSKRDAWSVPVRYMWGNHSINAHYTWAQRDKAAAASTLDTKAAMWAIGYAYDLSKRTSVGVTYAQINNHTNAAYNLFASTSLGLGTTGIVPGEDPKMWGVTMRHQF